MKELLAVKANNKNVTHIEVRTRYDLGGVCYATYKMKPRGYYLDVTPIERRDMGNGCVMTGFVAFSGYTTLLNEVKRKSNKGEAVADGIAQIKKKELIKAVLEKNGLELA